MKLAEALVNRSELTSRLANMRDRLNRSSQVQEGEKPPEDPTKLLVELDEITLQLTDLTKRINQTNNVTIVSEGLTLSDLLAERDILMKKKRILSSLVESAASLIQRYSRSEIKIMSTVDVTKLQKQADELSKLVREKDMQVQEKNWLVDLI